MWWVSRGLRYCNVRSHCLNSTEVFPHPSKFFGESGSINLLSFTSACRQKLLCEGIKTDCGVLLWCTFVLVEFLLNYPKEWGQTGNQCKPMKLCPNVPAADQTPITPNVIDLEGQNRKKYSGFAGRELEFLLLSSWLTGEECSYGRLVLSGGSLREWGKNWVYSHAQLLSLTCNRSKGSRKWGPGYCREFPYN